MNGYIVDALTLGASEGFVVAKHTALGIGMWMGIIMWFNVWFVIWPNQKRALGMVEVDAETKAASARTAMLFSRTNTLLSYSDAVRHDFGSEHFLIHLAHCKNLVEKPGIAGLLSLWGVKHHLLHWWPATPSG